MAKFQVELGDGSGNIRTGYSEILEGTQEECVHDWLEHNVASNHCWCGKQLEQEDHWWNCPIFMTHEDPSTDEHVSECWEVIVTPVEEYGRDDADNIIPC